MKASASEQLDLLSVQEHDTHLTQLQHRLKTLPQAQELASARDRVARLAKELIAARTIVSDLQREQAKADADVDLVRERARKDRELMDSGSIGDPKQLQSLGSELESLAKRQVELEDIELEIMERLEGAQAAVVHVEGELSAAESSQATLESEVAQLESEIAQERSAVLAQREQLVEKISTDLMTLYDKIRADHAGVGAARLYRGRCEGCRLELSPTEIASLKAAAEDEVLRCEDCRCILVRTSDSGL
jgi:predicted  nucleic acid-binding Zn-ribbon protein